MSSQIIYTRGCIVTLVAFVWLFSTVCFHMFPQTICPRGCIVTLVAFVWPLPIVCFQMFLQTAFQRKFQVTLVTSFGIFAFLFHGELDISLTFIWTILSQVFIHHQHTNKWCVLRNVSFKLQTNQDYLALEYKVWIRRKNESEIIQFFDISAIKCRDIYGKAPKNKRPF